MFARFIIASLVVFAVFFAATSVWAQDDPANGSLDIMAVDCTEQESAVYAGQPGGSQPSYPGDDCAVSNEGIFTITSSADPSQVYTIDLADGLYQELPVGEYTVEDTTTGLTDTAVIESLMPTPVHAVRNTSEAPAEPATTVVYVRGYDCINLDTEAIVVADPGQHVGCEESDTPVTVSFYLYGDDSGDPVLVINTADDGFGPFEIPEGGYQVIHEETQAFVDAELWSDREHSILVGLAVDAAPTPAPTEEPVTPEPTSPAPTSEATAPVTELPKTGSGSAIGIGPAVLMGVIAGGLIAAAAISRRITRRV